MYYRDKMIEHFKTSNKPVQCYVDDLSEERAKKDTDYTQVMVSYDLASDSFISSEGRTPWKYAVPVDPKDIQTMSINTTTGQDGKKSSVIIQHFNYQHLPTHLQEVSKQCHDLAVAMDQALPSGPEKSAGLRKLLEAKDCFVRANLAK